MYPVRRSADLQSAVKKCPNHFGLCGFVIRNKQECPYLILGDYKSPGFNRSNLFLRRISNPSGRLSVSNLSGRLSVSNLSGRLSVSNLSGRLSVSNPSGRLSVSNPSGRLSVSNLSGRLSVSNLSGRLSVFR